MPKKKSKKDRDFQKVKFKVGKKLPKAENVTSTAFKSKSIIVKEQLKETSTDNLRQDVLKRSRNPQELLAHLQHYNASFRLNSLNTIKAIITSDPNKLALHMGAVIDKVSSLTSDRERDIRSAVLECLRAIFSKLGLREISAYIPTITAHLRCAMTHLNEDVKLDSLQFLDILVTKYPSALNQDMFRICENFLDLISTRTASGKRSLKASPNSKMSTTKWRQQAFHHLDQLLAIRVGSRLGQVDAANTDSTETGNLKGSKVKGHGLLYSELSSHLYLATRGLEDYTIAYHNISSGDVGNEDLLLLSFVREILPLLRETWVELRASEDGAVSADSSGSLLSVVDIINRLYQMVVTSEIKDTKSVLNLLKTEVMHCVENGFPVSAGRFHPSKASRGNKKTSSSGGCFIAITVQSKSRAQFLFQGWLPPGRDISFAETCITILNLKLCLLANLLECSTRATQKHVNELIGGDNLDEFGEYLEVMLQNIHPGETLERVIINLASQRHCSESRISLLTSVIHRQVTSKSRLHADTGDTIVSLICKAELNSAARAALLSALNKACLMGKYSLRSDLFCPLFNDITSGYMSRSTVEGKDGCLESDEERAEMKLLFTLLYHVDDVGVSDVLRPLTRLLWQPCIVPDSLVGLLLHILHSRTQGTGLSVSHYISFLATLIGGDSTRDTQLEHVRHLTLSVVQPVITHIHLAFPNSAQVFTLAEYYYGKFMMTDRKPLPLCTCVSVLEANMSHLLFTDQFVQDTFVQLVRHLAKEPQSTGDRNGPEVSQLTSENYSFDLGGKDLLKRFTQSQPVISQTVYHLLAEDVLGDSPVVHQVMLMIETNSPGVELMDT